MALAVEIATVDKISILERDSLRIEQAADTFVATANFTLTDRAGTTDVNMKDTIEITDGAMVYFKGTVGAVELQIITITDKIGRFIHVECQDYNILLDETVVENETYDDLEHADNEIIDDLFTTYLPAINSTDEVAQLDPAVDEMILIAVTMRDALNALCSRTGGRFYVDFDKKLHYFDAEGSAANFALSDVPAGGDPKGYESFRMREDGYQLANSFYIVGEDVEDLEINQPSIDAYGTLQVPIRDNQLNTDAGVDARGAALLGAYKDPKFVYFIVTPDGAGLAVGEDLTFTNAACDISGVTETIRRLTIRWRNDSPVWELECGEVLPGSMSTVGQAEFEAGQLEQFPIVPGAGLDTTGPVVGMDTGNLIIRYGADGSTTDYPATSDGLDAATAAASAEDIIWIPSFEIPGDHTLANSVKYTGASQWGTVLTGEITAGDETTLENLSINRAADNADTLKGLIAPTIGMAYTNDVIIYIFQSGSGDAHAVSGSTGRVENRGGRFDGHSAGGDGYAGYLNGSPRGDLYFHDSYCCGSTAPFNTAYGGDQLVFTSHVTFCNVAAYEGGDGDAERGYWCGGYKGGAPEDSAVTEKITFSTEAVAAVVGANLSEAREGAGAASSAVAGYMAGGQVAAAVDTADKLTFSTETTAAVGTADLSVARGWVAGVSGGSQRGYFCGGHTDTEVATTDMLTYATNATAARSAADLSLARRLACGITEGSSKGYICGGRDGQADEAGAVITTDKITYATDTAAACATADLSGTGRSGVGGIQRERHKAFLCGGSINASTSEVVATTDKLTFGTDTMAAKATADLSATRHATGGVSSGGVKGFIGGGAQTGGDPLIKTIIDKCTYATEVTSASASVLTEARSTPAGVGAR